MDHELRYHPDVDQLAVVSAVDDSLEDLLPLSRLHASPEEFEDVWSSLEQLGVFGISLSEDEGGSGLGAAEEALIAVGLGRRLASQAVLATVGAIHAKREGTSIASLAGRRVTSGYRHGGRIVLVEDDKADLVLLRDGENAALYDAQSLPSESLERRLWLDRLRTSSALAEPVAKFDAAGLLRLRLLDAALLAGIAEASLKMGVAYALLREQFGRQIGSFQAVKHHCSNMAIAARNARDQVSFAGIAIDDAREDAALQVDCALLVAGHAALDNAGKNIQIHGGIGFSDEADPHLLVKRAQVQITLAGGLEATNHRIADFKTGWF